MKVSVKLYGDGWAGVYDLALTAVDKVGLKYPSDEWKHKMLECRHSPLRALIYKIKIEDIPRWIALQLKTHSVGTVQVMRSSRPDIYGKERGSQDELTTLNGIYSAEALINMAGKRLCSCAHRETRGVMSDIAFEISRIDPVLGCAMVPQCWGMEKCPERFQNPDGDFCMVGMAGRC